MTDCPKCGKTHEGEGIPPSLQGKMKICSECYKAVKKAADDRWRKENKGRVNSTRRIKRLENPMATAQEWKDRRLRWKRNKATRKAKQHD